MVSRDVLHELVDSLPEAEIATAERFLTTISKEPIGPEFSESIRRSLAQADTGDTVVCRDYGEMVEKLLVQSQALRFPFTTEARTQLRAIDRPVALRILETFAQFGESGVGDVSPLHGEWQGCFRLRCGDVLSNALELSTLAVPTPAVRTPLGEPGIGMAVGIDIRTVKEVEGISELMCGNGNGQATWRMIFASCSRIQAAGWGSSGQYLCVQRKLVQGSY